MSRYALKLNAKQMRVRRVGVRGRNVLPTTKCNFLIGFKIVNTICSKLVDILEAELLHISHLELHNPKFAKNITIERDINFELCVTAKIKSMNRQFF